MLQISYIRENKEKVIKALQKRGFKEIEKIEELLRLDESKRSIQSQSDIVASQANASAKQVGELMRSGKREEAEVIKANSSEFKEQIKAFAEDITELDLQIQDILVIIPNIPHESVPEGLTAEENEVVFQYGEDPDLSQEALPHWELTSKYDIIDFELGTKIAGAGFPVYKGKGAKLQRALINFFLDEAEKAGYIEVQPPIVINEASGFGTGQLPDKEGQMYFIGQDNLFLIPTAEVPVTNIYRDTIVKEADFPIKHCAYTPCFRREAGSYGAHVRGLNRLHQFDKVELVQIVHPDQSYQILEEMSSYVQSLLKKLGLKYRVLRLCGGDMGFTSALTYDMEVWSAAQKRWLEVSSVSNFETFQSNRLKVRFKDENGKMRLAHTLNGSALALPRIVAAILENFQTEQGVRVPEALQAYTRFEFID
jgi:seryl-tRNA synthetase